MVQHLITYHQSIILEKNNPVVITILNFSTTASRKKPVSTFYDFITTQIEKGKHFGRKLNVLVVNCNIISIVRVLEFFYLPKSYHCEDLRRGSL